MNVSIHNLEAEGYVECPRCRMWHRNLFGPMAVTTRKRHNPETDKMESFETVSQVCDKCCDSLLEAFTDPDWRLFWPLITDEEAETIVTRIKEARKAELAHFRRT